MDTRFLRILLTANMAVFLAICVAFLLHFLDVGLYPDGLEAWFDNNQWLMWTAVALSVVSALTLPPLHMSTRDNR